MHSYSYFVLDNRDNILSQRETFNNAKRFRTLMKRLYPQEEFRVILSYKDGNKILTKDITKECKR